MLLGHLPLRVEGVLGEEHLLPPLERRFRLGDGRGRLLRHVVALVAEAFVHGAEVQDGQAQSWLDGALSRQDPARVGRVVGLQSLCRSKSTLELWRQPSNTDAPRLIPQRFPGYFMIL